MDSINGKAANGKRALRVALIILFAVVLIFTAFCAYMLYLWKTGDRLNKEGMFVAEQKTEASFEREDAPQTTTAKETPVYEGEPTVEHDGKYYTFNDNVFSILFIGVDTTDDERFASIGLTAHQADSLILAAINSETNSLTMINIPRTTITDVRQLDPAFNYARTTRSPVCIQYAFGDGKALSCTMTRDAVSNILFNIPIGRYISMNLDGLFAANDKIGGVTVTILDDMTAFNPKMKKGAEYRLMGKDAEIYVARRIGEGLDGTNASRIKRQIQYYKAFFTAAKSKLKQDPMFAVNMYSAMGSSVQTDLSLTEIIYLSKVVVDMDISDDNVFTLEGETQNEDFFVDDAALKDLIIEVFYSEVK